jgi:hypothetical protein
VCHRTAGENETDEQETALPTREVVFGHDPVGSLDLDPSGEVEPHQESSRDSARYRPYVPEEEAQMTENRMLIECPCGAVLEENSAEAVTAAAQRHAVEVHDMTLSDDQARAMARPA